MASQTVITEQIVKDICDSLRDGLTLGGACAIAGVPTRDVRAWLERGQSDADDEETRIYAKFVQEVERATASIERMMLKPVLDAVRNGNWKPAEFFLKARFPAYMTKVNIDSELGVIMAAIAKNCPPDVEKKILAEITMSRELDTGS